MSINVPVVLFTVPASEWAPGHQSSPWPAILAVESMLGRRLAKGVDLRDVRLALLSLGRQVSAAVRADSISERWDVPADLLQPWDELLARLAQHRGRVGGERLGRQRAAPFFPCAFAPGPAEAHDAGSYGLLTVTGHVAELSALDQDLTGLTLGLLTALEHRRARFARAATLNAGIVEWVLPE